MNIKELDILMKGVTSKFFVEYIEAISKPRTENKEIVELIEKIRSSDEYKAKKNELRQEYTNKDDILIDQLCKRIIMDLLLLSEIQEATEISKD